jgi:hypothetical protein
VSGFEDALVAATFALVLNAFVLYRIQRSFPWEESRFLGRVYIATLLLRYALAVFLNVYSEDSPCPHLWGLEPLRSGSHAPASS